MGKLCLIMPGNSFHANLQSEDMERMHNEQYGFPVFRKYNVPATVFFQGVDFLMHPPLRGILESCPSLSFGNSTFSHAMMPMFHKYNCSEEIEAAFYGNLPIWFFSEFAIPQYIVHIREKIVTMVLTSKSVLQDADGNINDFPNAPVIELGIGKKALLLREELFGPFLKALFLFFRYSIYCRPKDHQYTKNLIEEVRKIKQMPDDVIVICPIDVEAPWIGSHFGSVAWDNFFRALINNDLLDVISPLSQHLPDLLSSAVSVYGWPNREMGKWTTWPDQMAHRDLLSDFAFVNYPSTKYSRMIASGSDIFAAMGNRNQAKTAGDITLKANSNEGRSSLRVIGFNQSVINVQMAALRAANNNTPLIIELDKLRRKDYFINLAIDMAKNNPF